MSTPAFSGDPGLAGDEAAWLEAHFGACAPEYRAMLDEAGIRPGDHVLDLGCGSGQFLPWIAEQTGPGGRVTAIDISLANLARARATIDPLAVRWGVAGGGALALPLRDGCVDVAWCANVFEYMSNEERVASLREMTRVLRPGGMLAVKDSEWAHKVFHPVPLEFWYRFMGRLVVEDSGPFVGRHLAGAFRAAGLEPRIRTFLSERLAPLNEIERRWIGMSGRAVAADARRFLGPLEAAEAAAFASLFDEGRAECILDREDFYYCESSVVAVARTPA